MINFTNYFSAIGKRIDDKFKRKWSGVFLFGYEEGLKKGLSNKFNITSELSKEENELLTLFLIRHNFCLSYDPENGGFRVRKNKFHKKNKETVISVLKEGSDYETITMPIVEYELLNLRKELKEIEELSLKERDILGIKNHKHIRVNI